MIKIRWYKLEKTCLMAFSDMVRVARTKEADDEDYMTLILNKFIG